VQTKDPAIYRDGFKTNLSIPNRSQCLPFRNQVAINTIDICKQMFNTQDTLITTFVKIDELETGISIQMVSHQVIKALF
jgi:hypothetical protein